MTLGRKLCAHKTSGSGSCLVTSRFLLWFGKQSHKYVLWLEDNVVEDKGNSDGYDLERWWQWWECEQGWWWKWLFDEYDQELFIIIISVITITEAALIIMMRTIIMIIVIGDDNDGGRPSSSDKCAVQPRGGGAPTLNTLLQIIRSFSLIIKVIPNCISHNHHKAKSILWSSSL